MNADQFTSNAKRETGRNFAFPAFVLSGVLTVLLLSGCQNPYLIRKSYTPNGIASPATRSEGCPQTETQTAAVTVHKIERGQMDYSGDTFVYGGGSAGGTSTSSGLTSSTGGGFTDYQTDTAAPSGNVKLAASDDSGVQKNSTETSAVSPEATAALPETDTVIPDAGEDFPQFSGDGLLADNSSLEDPLSGFPLQESSVGHLVADDPKTVASATPERIASRLTTADQSSQNSGLDPLPTESEFPEFARNAYEALEPSERELRAVSEPGQKATLPRERESITDREKAEADLKKDYQEWLSRQKASQKEKDKIPRYLQPLSNDHEVFDNPDSPFSRQMKADADKEHQFIREITAADLNMMSDVSSTRELMDWEKEQDMPVDWSKYSAKSLYNKWRDFLGMGPNEREALVIMKKATLVQMEYEKTKDVKKLREAADLYEKAGKKWPESILEEDALFYAAECHFFDRNYAKAKTFYKALVTKYSNSILRADAMDRLYYIGVYWVQCAEEDPEVIGRFEGKQRPRFSDFAGAKDAFETIFTNDISDRGRAPDALYALASAYMRRGVEQGDASYDSAAKYYQRLYEFYPACKYVDKAYQLAMLSLYLSYRGPLYDSTPLKKAEEIAKIAQRAKKGDAKVIAEQLRLIREKQAEYLLVRGEYYEKKKVYAAARNYYNRLVKEYPESEYAVAAAGHYNDIRENPAEADQFALVRPVAPFLPKSKNKYYEDRPNEMIDSALARSEEIKSGNRESDLTQPDFTALEKTAGLEPGVKAEKKTVK